MNILASYNWIKEYLQTSVSPEDFAKELSLKSMSVEKIENFAEKFDKMVVGVIKEIKAHPNANKLRVAITDVGDRVVDIVCGGTNIAAGQKVLVALPGAKVKWHGEGEDIILTETEIRGVKSVGMICAAAEIGFDKIPAGEHEIWDLTGVTNAPAGTPLAEALELNDTVFDIEVTTNRPDCMGIIGLAREGAASVDGEFKMGEIPRPSDGLGMTVKVESKLCSRYMAAVVKNVKVGPSPWWLQKKLLLAGHRPINNIVDITNLVLHEYGQPLHAFDRAKIHGDSIIIREAKRGEKIKALDGKTYELSKKNLVIADSEGPVAIAGVMGGQESSTTSQTTTVVFEAATFDQVSVRRTARDLNLYSDSQLVFEKGLSTEALPAALARAVELAKQIAGGVADGIVDERRVPYKPLVFSTTGKKIRERIGVEISDADIEKILKKLGFALEIKGSSIKATVPFWRDHDMENEVDLTEEVARIYGYHNMPSVLPVLAPSPAVEDKSITWEARLKNVMAAAGYTEFFGLSFAEAKELEKYGLSPTEAVKILNPLTAELTHLRTSLIPGMLRDIEHNQATSPSAHVFELSRVYLPSVQTLSADEGPRESGLNLPQEELRLLVSEYGFDNAETAFMSLKGTLAHISKKIGVTLHLNRKSDDPKWHPGRTAQIFIEQGPERIEVGTLGQVAHPFTRAFGLEKAVMMIDLNLERLLPHLKQSLHAEPISSWPVSTRDLSFVVNERTEYEDVVSVITEAGSLVRSVALVDIYRGVGVEEGKKSLTVSVTFGATDRTLTSEEIDAALKTITAALETKFAAVLRS